MTTKQMSEKLSIGQNTVAVNCRRLIKRNIIGCKRVPVEGRFQKTFLYYIIDGR